MSTSTLLTMALSWMEMYGMMPTTAMMVAAMPKPALFPYRAEMKSATEVMR